LAGGPGDFIDTLLESDETPLDVQARGLVSEWEELKRVAPSADRSWLRPLIEHVYGRERARELYAAD
jgi:hypothetical protein